MTGAHSHVSNLYDETLRAKFLILESLVAHRAQRLLAMMPNALMYGYTEIDPEIEPLKVSP